MLMMALQLQKYLKPRFLRGSWSLGLFLGSPELEANQVEPLGRRMTPDSSDIVIWLCLKKGCLYVEEIVIMLPTTKYKVKLAILRYPCIPFLNKHENSGYNIHVTILHVMITLIIYPRDDQLLVK